MSFKIDLLWDTSVSQAPSGFKTAVQNAAAVFDTHILDNVTVSINVGWGEDEGSPIGSALATGGPDNAVGCSYSQLTGALTQQAVANGMPGIVANLPASDPAQGLGTWEVSQAQAKVFGLSNPYPTPTDGGIGFSNTVSWATGSQTQGVNQYDLFGTALHEISHALGRLNNAAYGQYSALNLYTYASPGNLQTGSAAPAYFSVDGGNTNLNNFDMSANGDPADWSTTLTDSFGGGMAGVPAPMTVTDWLVMESIGYKIAPIYILAGPSSVNEGAHDYLQLSTVNVAPGTKLAYTIGGISASQLDSASLGGNVTVGSDGTALIDLGISAALAAPAHATVNLGNGLASYSVTVENSVNNAVHFGSPGSVQYTTSANDTFYGVANDVVGFSGNSTDYLITVASPGTIQVQDPVPGRDGTDTLTGVERMQFQDTNLAFDLLPGQSGGEAAEMLGAAFGKGSISNAAWVGTGLNLFDAGYSMTKVAQMAINTRLVSAPDYSSFVQAVWYNVFGTTIDANNLNNFTQMLQNGQYTEAQLLAIAAGSTVNQAHIGLPGLAAHGLAYV